MPRYTFNCASDEHPTEEPRSFELVIQHGEGKRIDQARCACGATAKRDFAGDLATVNSIGSTPIAVSDAKHSIGKELSFAFGRFKKNPDGTVDRNHAPFRDTGEMSRFMAGQNTLGEPVVDDRGKAVKRADGTVVRRGAKIFKYGANATPSKSGVREGRPRMRSIGGITPGWGNAREAAAVGRRGAEDVPIISKCERVKMRERKA